MPTIDELISANSNTLGTSIVTPEETGKTNIESIEAVERREESAASSSVIDRLGAATDAFAASNGAIGIFDYLDTQYQFGAEDKEFTAGWDLKAATEYMNNANIPFKYMPRISEAKSQFGLMEITRGIQRDMEREQNIAEHLGVKATTAATIGGMLIDADLAIPFAKVAKAGSVIKAMSKPMSLEAAWVTARSYTDDDYTSTDAVLDFAMVGTIIGGMSVLQKKRLSRVSEMKADAPDIKSSGTKSAEEAMDAKATAKESEYTTQDIKQNEKAINDIADVSDVKTAKVLRGEAEAVAAVKKESDIGAKNISEAAEELRIIIKDSEITESAAGIRIKKQLQELVDEVKAVDNGYGQSLQHALDVKAGDFKAPKIYAKTQPDGSVMLTNDKGKSVGRKIPAAVAVSILGAGAVSADEGAEFEVSNMGYYILALVAAGFIGKRGYEAVKDEGSIIRAAKATYKNIQDARKATSMVVNKQAGRIFQTEAMMARTALTETYAPFAKAGGKAKELADMFLVNAMDGTHKTAEVSKRAIARIAETKYRKVEHDAFNDWLKVHHDDVNRVFNPIKAAKLHREFRELVVDAAEFGNHTDENILKAADALSGQIGGLTTHAGQAGAKGFDKIKVKKNHIPRYWKNASIRGIIEATATDAEKVANKKAIESAITDMIYGGQKTKDLNKAKLEAEAWVDDIMNQRAVDTNRQRNSMLGRIQQLLDEKGVTTIDDEELASALSKESDKIGRAMYRKKLDLTAFKPFTITVNGKKQEIKLSDFIERDAATIIQRYSNEMAGQIALAERGFNTTEAARKVVDEIPDPKLRSRMHTVIDLLVGEQLLHLGREEQTFLEMATGATFIAKLPMVTFSMLSEVAKVATMSNGLKYALNSFYEKVNGAGKYSAIRDEMMRATGLGTATIRRESGFRGADEISNIYDAGEGAFHNYMRGAKDIASVWYGLLPVSDALQRISMVANAERLAKFFESGTGISERRMVQYGITEESKRLLKDKLIMKDGELQRLGIDDWTRAEKEEFNNIIFRMNQAITQETTLGGTGLYMHTSVVGKAASYLLTFPAEAFSNHGLRELTSADYEAFVSMTSFLMGAYVAAKLRYASQGKEVDDDTIMYRAIIQMPIFGALSTAEGISDPVVFDVLSNIISVGKLSNYEKEFIGEQE